MWKTRKDLSFTVQFCTPHVFSHFFSNDQTNCYHAKNSKNNASQHKICPPRHFSEFKFLIFYLALLLDLAATPCSAQDQGLECGLDIPTQIVQELIEKAPLIEEFIANMKAEGTGQLNMAPAVPVRFTAIYGPGGGGGLSQAQADFGINALNQAFAPAGISFVQCGDINEIYDDRIKASEEIDHFITSFAYATGTIELYVKPSIPKPYAPIPDQSYQSGNPNWQFPLFEHTNFVKLNASAQVTTPTFVHETGHHFGLLHTHWMSSTSYLAPPPATANDFPYPVLDQNNQIIPTWWGRELVIRQPDGTKAYGIINYPRAGDLIGDTPADCSWQLTSLFPGCPISAQNIPGCDFNSALTYVDYNGDAVYPPPAGLSLGRNFMSSWTESCLNQFTPLQHDRARFYFETVRQPLYTQDKCGTFTDRVELEGTANGLENVTVRVRHGGSPQKCNVTSGRLGDFSGVIHQDNLQTNIYQNGKKSALNFPGDPLKVHYDHTRCEWIRGVNVADLALISKHILGMTPLSNGYRLIAADANRSKSVTTFDMVELRKLILGIYPDFLPNQEQPFQYIPEFVPLNAGAPFDINPFGVLGGAYLDQGWQYVIPNPGQRGFDGIKIGDVNFSWLNASDCPTEGAPQEGGGSTGGATLAVPTSGLAQDDVVALTVKVQNAQQLSGFQFGLNIPFAQFEVMDVITNTLPNFTKEDNFGLNLSNQDALTTLWFDQSGGSQVFPAESPIFNIIVKAKQPISNLQALISLDGETLPAMFLQPGGSTTTSPVALTIEVGPAVGNRSVDVENKSSNLGELQCDPNPMQNSLRVAFTNIGTESEGVLSLTDFRGALVHQQMVRLQSGENILSIDTLEKIPAGVYLVKLKVNDAIISSKILKN